MKDQWFLMYTLFLHKKKIYFCLIIPILTSFKAELLDSLKAKEMVFQSLSVNILYLHYKQRYQSDTLYQL